eukprot:scaffold103184_cov19-Tisochrysis_lutea.AAC.2
MLHVVLCNTLICQGCSWGASVDLGWLKGARTTLYVVLCDTLMRQGCSWGASVDLGWLKGAGITLYVVLCDTLIRPGCAWGASVDLGWLQGICQRVGLEGTCQGVKLEIIDTPGLRAAAGDSAANARVLRQIRRCAHEQECTT